MTSEVVERVEVKFTENVPGSKDGMIVVTEGKTLAEAIKKEYQRRYNALVMGGVRILNNPELLVTVKKILVITSHPKGTKALRRAMVKAIAAEKMVTELREILVELRKEIKRLKPTPGIKNSAY